MQSEGSSYKVTILKNSEKPTGLHPLLSGIGNERVNTCDKYINQNPLGVLVCVVAIKTFICMKKAKVMLSNSEY